MFSLALFAFALCASAQGRAVNISNTWVLPEEGFPVFYRYFRDRISWYEADAVCQFHHANLVTVDTTAQYDAVRAYLKELDISSAVWVGLIRSNPDGDFTWTDYRGLGGDGYWSSAPDPRAAPLCAAADPAADYRWEARTCGGPTVASFICELPVPQWALGNEGCMVKALPALTALYLPESAAVQLTADCGLAGVKRVQCTGNVKREDLLRDLSCAEDDDTSTTITVGLTGATSTITPENLFTDQDTVNEVTTEENITTEHEDDINQSSTIKPLISKETLNKVFNNEHSDMIMNKNINLDVSFNNNLQSNDIPKLGENNNFLASDLSDKLEDEKNKQHKMLHDEFARHGNFETIFTQPTDHFVPPLVMAKAKISDDMTVLSIEEKHAQKLAEQRYSKKSHGLDHNADTISSTILPISENPNEVNMSDKPLITTKSPLFVDDSKKDTKTIVPKKYHDKIYKLKGKTTKSVDVKPTKVDKSTKSGLSSTTEKTFKESGIEYVNDAYSDKSEDEPTIDLTVIIKEPNTPKDQNTHSNSSEIPEIKIIRNDSSISEPEIKLEHPVTSSGEVTQEISLKMPSKSLNNITSTHQVIKITILKDDDPTVKPTEFLVVTRMPIFYDNKSTLQEETTKDNVASVQFLSTEINSTTNETSGTTTETPVTTPIILGTSTSESTVVHETKMDTSTQSPQHLTTSSSSASPLFTEAVTSGYESNYTTETNISNTDAQVVTEKDIFDVQTESEDILVNTTDTSQTIDDFQSPLLSAANEPLHRPNRSRRPQPPPNRNKFNPFRMLG